MKPRVCKCCGERIIVGLVPPPTTHLCLECARTEEPGEVEEEEAEERNSKIIFLDSFG